MKDIISRRIADSLQVKKDILDQGEFVPMIESVANDCVTQLKVGGKILFCGNGGSASDAQHLAAELSGRYYFDRAPLAAEALHVNTSYLTAVANDYSYDVVYSRMLEGFGKKEDMLFAFSTSGSSKNIINAANSAKKMGMKVVGFTGQKDSLLAKTSDYCFRVPSLDTPRIQESHILIGHVICELIEAEMFPR